MEKGKINSLWLRPVGGVGMVSFPPDVLQLPGVQVNRAEGIVTFANGKQYELHSAVWGHLNEDPNIAINLMGVKNNLSEKVDKEGGKGLSTHDFTTDYKKKLEGIDMSTKVDKEGGKGLSTHDFTDAYIEKIKTLENTVSQLQEKIKALEQKEIDEAALKAAFDAGFSSVTPVAFST